MKRHISQFVAAFTFAIIMCVGFSATAAPPFETNVFNFKNDVSLMGADHTVTAVVMPLFNYPATEVFDDTGTGVVTNANAATTSKNGDNIGMAGFTKSIGTVTTFDDTGTNLTRHDASAAITTTAKDDDIGAMTHFNCSTTEVFDDTGTGVVTNANAATTSKNGDNIGMAGFTKSTGKATTFDDTGTNLTRHDAIAAITTTAKDDDIGAMTHFNCSATEVFDDTGTGIVTNVNAATRITRSDQQLDDGSFTAMNMNQTQVVCFNDTGGSMFQDYNMVNDSGNQRLTTFAGNFNSTSNA
jgi:hypothetical protein